MAEVQSGHYASASEVVREALRIWRERQIEKNISLLERAHAGAFDRDTTPAEEQAILRLQRKARASIKAKVRK